MDNNTPQEEDNPFAQFTEQASKAPQEAQGAIAKESSDPSQQISNLQQSNSKQPPAEEANPFDQFSSDKTAPAPPPVQQPSANDNGAFMAGVDQVNRSFGKMVEGVLQAGAVASSYLGGGKEMGDYADKVQAVSNINQQAADTSAKQHPNAALAGKFFGDTVRTIPAFMMTGIGGGILAQLAKGATANAGVNALEIAPDTATKVSNILEGGALGMLGTAGGMAAGTALRGIGMATKDVGGLFGKLVPNAIKDTSLPVAAPNAPNTSSSILTRFLTPNKAAVGDVAQEVSQAGGMDKVLAKGEAAKSMDYNLSPAEQIGTQSARNAEGKIVLDSPVTKQRLAESQIANKEKVAGNLMSTIDNLVPKGVEATKIEKDALFSKLKEYNVTRPQWDTLNDNPTISKYMKGISKNVDLPSEYEGLGFNNVYKLNAVSKSINDDLYKKATSVTSPSTKNLNSDSLKALNEAQDTLHSVMNEASTGLYNKANALAQQLILKKNITKSISEIPKAPGQTDVSLSQVYEKLFPNEESAGIFAKMVETTGGNPEITKNLITVLNQIRKSPVDEILARPAGFTPVQVAGRTVGIVERAVLGMIKGRYNTAMANLISSGKWQPEVAKALAAKTLSQKASNLALLLKSMPKAAAVGVANQGKPLLPQIQNSRGTIPIDPNNRSKGYTELY